MVGAHPKGDMMTIKLIATDMDGTLLDSRGQLDLPRLEKILDQLDQRDIRFVIATGNEIHRMRELLGHLAERVVLVVANGARIFENNKLIQAQTWDDAMVDKALVHFKGRECRDQFVVTGMNGGFVKKGTVFTELDKFMTPEMIEKLYQRMNFVEELQADLFGGVLKMSMVVGEERSSSVLQEINDLFDGRVRAVSSGYGCIDILQAGVHKAWGLEELLKRWNLKSEQIMAFGDSENDVEMLELAGIAYAMENADDEAKAVATALAPANSQGGVYQVLENWLLKEQAKIQTKYRELNQISVLEPDVIFIGDSIVEYYPLQELFGTAKTIVNRGIRGYQTGLLLDNLDAHLYGDAVDQIVLLIGTNDIGRDIPLNEALDNLERVIQSIARDYPLSQIKLLSILPVNEGEKYKQTVYIRTNEKIREWNQAYETLASAYMQVDFVPVYDSLTDSEGQLQSAYTTDGLHLSVAGYQALSEALKGYLF